MTSLASAMLVFELMEYFTKEETTLTHAWWSCCGEFALVDKNRITMAIIFGCCEIINLPWIHATSS